MNKISFSLPCCDFPCIYCAICSQHLWMRVTFLSHHLWRFDMNQPVSCVWWIWFNCISVLRVRAIIREQGPLQGRGQLHKLVWRHLARRDVFCLPSWIWQGIALLLEEVQALTAGEMLSLGSEKSEILGDNKSLLSFCFQKDDVRKTKSL